MVDAATAKLRMQQDYETEPPALTHGGEVLDNATARNGVSTAEGPAVGSNGKGRKARAGV